MNELKHAKEIYDDISIPSELSDRVQAGIRKGRAYYQRRRSRAVRRWIGIAACFCLMLAGLNLSPALAKAAANVPVLGGLFQVLTFADYDKTEGGIDYSITVPEVEAESMLAEKVNAAIQEKVDQHLAKAQQDWADYREAFLATGGTEEEWAGRKMDVIIDYEIKSRTEDRVSFIVSFAEGWVSSQEERYYYNLDFAEGRDLRLRDFLGEDWISVCNASIQRQIDESVNADGSTLFFAPGEGGFTTVDENTDFYVREDGKVVVCFPKYSIAAGAAGNLEFVIQISED